MLSRQNISNDDIHIDEDDDRYEEGDDEEEEGNVETERKPKMATKRGNRFREKELPADGLRLNPG